MIINNHKLKVSMAVYDNCHKIFIPVEGQETLFIRKMKKKGWTFKENFYRIDSVTDLMNMYIDSCPLRFIDQIDFSGDKEKTIKIIPQGSFTDEGFLDEELVRKAFVA